MVTVGALNTQKAIAREIMEAEADYVLALKGNHPLLHQEVSDFLLDAKGRGFAGVAHDFFAEADKGHGRLEVRRHWITQKIDWLAPRAGWEALRCVGLVERERHTPAGVSIERAFYLCSIAPDAQLFARAVRGHWGVENSLHGRLDVLFQEDQSRAHRLCRRQPLGPAQACSQRRQSRQKRQRRHQGQTLPRHHQRRVPLSPPTSAF